MADTSEKRFSAEPDVGLGLSRDRLIFAGGLCFLFLNINDVGNPVRLETCHVQLTQKAAKCYTRSSSWPQRRQNALLHVFLGSHIAQLASGKSESFFGQTNAMHGNPQRWQSESLPVFWNLWFLYIFSESWNALLVRDVAWQIPQKSDSVLSQTWAANSKSG